MRNAILATLRVVADSLSVPQLHEVSLIVVLPPRAVRRLNTKTISHHMHRTPVLLELCRRTAHQTSKVSPLRLSPQKLLKTSKVKPKEQLQELRQLSNADYNWRNAAPLAYAGGSLGVLIGADLLNRMRRQAQVSLPLIFGADANRGASRRVDGAFSANQR